MFRMALSQILDLKQQTCEIWILSYENWPGVFLLIYDINIQFQCFCTTILIFSLIIPIHRDAEIWTVS